MHDGEDGQRVRGVVWLVVPAEAMTCKRTPAFTLQLLPDDNIRLKLISDWFKVKWLKISLFHNA